MRFPLLLETANGARLELIWQKRSELAQFTTNFPRE